MKRRYARDVPAVAIDAEPCAHLQRLADRPLLRGLVHRGGLRADVLGAGIVKLGDPIYAT